jgi:hypothetical protein
VIVVSARSDAAALERLVRQELEEAGFAVEPRPLPAEGGLTVRHDPARGVVVSWGPAAGAAGDDVARFPTIRNVVQLALRAVLTHAGYEVTAEGAEVIVTRGPLPHRRNLDR